MKCEKCPTPGALAQIYDHLVTRHNLKPLHYSWLGTKKHYFQGLEIAQNNWFAQLPLGKVGNNLQFILNWSQICMMDLTMFWISFCGSQKEAEEYELKIALKICWQRKGSVYRNKRVHLC